METSDDDDDGNLCCEPSLRDIILQRARRRRQVLLLFLCFSLSLACSFFFFFLSLLCSLLFSSLFFVFSPRPLSSDSLFVFLELSVNLFSSVPTIRIILDVPVCSLIHFFFFSQLFVCVGCFPFVVHTVVHAIRLLFVVRRCFLSFHTIRLLFVVRLCFLSFSLLLFSRCRQIRRCCGCATTVPPFAPRALSASTSTSTRDRRLIRGASLSSSDLQR